MMHTHILARHTEYVVNYLYVGENGVSRPPLKDTKSKPYRKALYPMTTQLESAHIFHLTHEEEEQLHEVIARSYLSTAEDVHEYLKRGGKLALEWCATDAHMWSYEDDTYAPCCHLKLLAFDVQPGKNKYDLKDTDSALEATSELLILDSTVDGESPEPYVAVEDALLEHLNITREDITLKMDNF